MLDLNKLSKELTPSQKEQEKIHKIINEIIKKIQKVLPEATIIPGGSFAKGTWLRDNHDIDLFAQFTKEKNIVEKIEYALKKKFKKIERIHGSRDYFSFKEKNLNVEVIPVLKIKDPKEAKNITDISPLHVQFVNTHADEKTKAEIRIAKAFFKAQQLYGAETYIKGFSGYVIELLIIYYGSFFNLLREMQGWKEKTILIF